MMEVPRYRLGSADHLIPVLRQACETNSWVLGRSIEELECLSAELTHARFTIATSSGFAALHLALEALEVEERAVAIPAVSTCFAVLNAVTAARAKPVFVDTDLDVALDFESIREHGLAAIVAPSHFGYRPNQVPTTLSQVPVVEDAAQSFLDVCQRGLSTELAVFSLYPSKGLNGIDGGLVSTHNARIAEQIRERRYYAQQRSHDGVRRFNYRLADIHAAVALESMQRLSEVEARFLQIQNYYLQELEDFPQVHVIGCARGTRSTRLTRFVLRFADATLSERFEQHMSHRGVKCGRELLALAPEAQLNTSFPTAAALLSATVSVPFFVALTDAEVEWVGASMVSALKSLPTTI